MISPCLSNIFLHHVLDEWFEFEVRPRLKGRCTFVRFADDAVMAFEDFLDAKRVLSVLGKRLARYGLHPSTRRGSSISATTDQMGLTIQRRMVPRSPSLASPTFGVSHGWVRMWGVTSNGKEPLRPRTGGDYGLVSGEPASVHPRRARPSDRDDAGPRCLLRHNRQLSTWQLVRPSGRDDLAEVAVAAGP